MSDEHCGHCGLAGAAFASYRYYFPQSLAFLIFSVLLQLPLRGWTRPSVQWSSHPTLLAWRKPELLRLRQVLLLVLRPEPLPFS
jgi:hypothetical protein